MASTVSILRAKNGLERFTNHEARNMTITPVDGVFEIKQRDSYVFAALNGRNVPLPGRPYLALRIRRQR